MNYFLSQAVGFYLNFVGVLNCTKQNCFWCIVYMYKRERVLSLVSLSTIACKQTEGNRQWSPKGRRSAAELGILGW